MLLAAPERISIPNTSKFRLGDPPSTLPEVVEIDEAPHARTESPARLRLERQRFPEPVSPGAGSRVRVRLDEMNEEASEQIFGLVQFRLAHVLDLIGDIFEVEFVRQVAASVAARRRKASACCCAQA